MGSARARPPHDVPQALLLLQGLTPAYVVADRRTHRRPRGYDAARYAQCHCFERLFSYPQQFRQLATRYEKLAAHFLAFVQLAATLLWLRDY